MVGLNDLYKSTKERVHCHLNQYLLKKLNLNFPLRYTKHYTHLHKLKLFNQKQDHRMWYQCLSVRANILLIKFQLKRGITPKL